MTEKQTTSLGRASRQPTIRERIEKWERLAKHSLEVGNIIDMDEQHCAMRDQLMFAWRAGDLIPVDELVLPADENMSKGNTQ